MLNEHTGGNRDQRSDRRARQGDSASGIVRVAGGLVYPLIGLMMITPSLPLPAGTLLGCTGLCIVIVN